MACTLHIGRSRTFLISWQNNRDCHITMPLSLKKMEAQIKGDQWNKRFRIVQAYCTHEHNHTDDRKWDLSPGPCWWVLMRTKQLPMAVTAGVIWSSSCARYWPYLGVGTCASVLKLVIFGLLSYIMKCKLKAKQDVDHKPSTSSLVHLTIIESVL